VAWLPTEIMPVNAPHPHAMPLFVDFLLSRGVQKRYADKLSAPERRAKSAVKNIVPTMANHGGV
jgi:ABC-type Fe3+ transport system substrate-binding protein